MLRLGIFALLLFPAALLAQQQYIFQHITVDDGLLSNPKVLTFQDDEGFYWFCSENGIQRFDGKNFITYKYSYHDTKGLAGDWANKLIEDKEKNIWIICEEGLLIYKRKERALSRLYMSDAPDSNISNICCIGKDGNGEIWILTSQNIFRYDYKTHKPLLIQKLGTNSMHAVYDSKKNGFWIILEKPPHAFLYFDCYSKKASSPLPSSIVGLFGYYNPVSLFEIDLNSNLWISNYLGDLCKYDVNTREVTYYSILHNRHNGKINLPNAATRDCLDDGKTIWFTSDNFAGLLKYDKKTELFSTLENENGAEYGLHYQNEAYTLFGDREGNIWINTDMGMNIFNPTQQQFKYLNNRTDSSGAPFSTDVTSFFESSKKEIWVSTWGAGVFRYDSNYHLLHNYSHKKNDPFSLGEPLSKAWCFGEDSAGQIWTGCQYAMLSVLDPSSGKFRNRYIPEFEKKTILFMVKDQKNNMWFALLSGFLAKWDAVSKKMLVFKNLYGDSAKNIHAIDGLFADGKNIWVAAGDDKLDRFDQDKNMVVQTAIFQHHITLFSMLTHSDIIGGTLNQGFFLYNIPTKSTRYITTENGLSSNNVYGALADHDNNAWIVTNESIERLNLNTGNITKFGIEDGIKDHVFERALYRLQNGTILVATNSGVIYFNPDSIRTVAPPPDVTLTMLRIAQKDISVDSTMQFDQLTLAHHDNSITIKFASLSFTGRKNIKYYYQLEGADRDWISAGQDPSVTYANLVPGRYTFKVKAQNRDGIESRRMTSLIIVITPPWWKAWWAYLLWFAIALLIFFAILDYRKRSRLELSQIRQKIATDLHDDIGSTLNSISVYSEIAGKQLQTNTENAREILLKMGVASRNMIDNMNDIVWAINPKNDQLENILQRMQYFAGELLSGKNILLQFTTDEKVKNIKLPMEKRKNFYLIFKEAINNAYKYSEAKTVTVHISQHANEMTMSIEDDGSGFEIAQKAFGGNGLRNMQTRAHEIGAHLNISSFQNRGTAIYLRMSI
jgi:ligand-binding sensor domain-containing protein/two-component sensor histidine kinase